MHVTTILRLQDLSDTVVDIEHDESTMKKGYHGSQIATEVETKLRELFEAQIQSSGYETLSFQITFIRLPLLKVLIMSI